MRAIVQTKSGPPEVLQLREIEKPTPKGNEVLIKVCAATVTRGDVAMRGLPFLLWIPMRILLGMRRKKIPGSEFAGVIEAVGREVSRFSAGDHIFGATGTTSAGSYAEYTCLSEEAAFAPKPMNLGFEGAAAAPIGGITALHFLRQGKVEGGQKVLIHGASGSVGTFATQLAVHFGAEVTGVCSTANIDMVKSLGATAVIDYTEDNFSETSERYDLIFDAAGVISKEDCESVLAVNGSFVSVQNGLARGNVEDLLTLKEIIESGALRPVIDRRYPLEQAAEAHAYVEKGHKKGNVVLTVSACHGS